MEVKEFIKTILKDVTEALQESDKENQKFRFHFNENINDYIDFDLAVVSKRTEEGKFGAEIVGIGGKIQGSASNEIVNRIKFRICTYEKR